MYKYKVANIIIVKIYQGKSVFACVYIYNFNQN